MPIRKIQELRKKIDEIDDKLVDLLNERARIVIEVGNIKKTENSTSTRLPGNGRSLSV